MLKRFLTLFMGLVMAGAVAAAPQPPDQVIKTTTDHLRDMIRQNVQAYRSNKDVFYKVVDDTLVPHFDSPYITQLVLGRNWRTANDQQRARFQEAFKNMLIHGYADSLLEYYDSVRIEIKPPRIDDRKIATVDTLIYRQSTPQPATVSFKLRQVGDEWKIFDVIVENISLVLNFRTQVDAEIKRTSLDDIIARMEKGEVIKPTVKESEQKDSGQKKSGSAG
jgi:phospholipid transport system substrate-binding protein